MTPTFSRLRLACSGCIRRTPASPWSPARCAPADPPATVSPAHQLHRALHRHPSHLAGELRHRGHHRSRRRWPCARRPPRRSRSRGSCPVVPAAAMASIAPSAIMSLQAKTASIVGVRLQHVLEHGEALVALPVGGLRGDDLDARRVLDRVPEAAQARVAGLVAGNALEHRDLRLAAGGVRRGARRRAARPRSCRSRRRSRSSPRPPSAAAGVDPRVHHHHRDARRVGLGDGGHDLARAAGRDAGAP